MAGLKALPFLCPAMAFKPVCSVLLGLFLACFSHPKRATTLATKIGAQMGLKCP